jgi:hypothetical protein
MCLSLVTKSNLWWSSGGKFLPATGNDANPNKAHTMAPALLAQGVSRVGAAHGKDDVMALEDLRNNGMMSHLLDSLEKGQDIGHYGRLVFAMVARHFIEEEELVGLLQNDKDFTEQQARALVQQVASRGYNPPRRDRILQWQKEQEFPICPDGDDPDACNVYKDLKFPDGVYQDIEEYREQKVASST